MLPLTLACVTEEAVYVVQDPTEVGPWPVGRETATIEDDRGGTLTVDVWYPATEAGEPSPYSPTIFTGLAELWAPRVEQRFPLVAFSHGNGGIRFQSFFVTEWLASHGFVVVAPDHPYNTLFDLDMDLLTEVMQRRPGDIARAATWAMGEFGAEDSYLVVGHSFGGWTTLAVAGGVLDPEGFRSFCEAGGDGELCDLVATDADVPDSPDPRAYGGVAMAPCGWYTFGETGLKDATGIAVMGGTKDDNCPMETEVAPTAEHLGDPTALYEVENGGHMVFSMMCAIGDIMDECGDPAYAEADAAQPGIKAWATAWALRQYSGDGAYDAWL